MASGRRVPDLVVPLLLMRKVPPLLTVRLAASSVPADSNIKRPPLTTMAPVKPAPEAPVRLRFPKPLAPLRARVPDPVKIPAYVPAVRPMVRLLEPSATVPTTRPDVALPPARPPMVSWLISWKVLA